jgi:hypothetical protein
MQPEDSVPKFVIWGFHGSENSSREFLGCDASEHITASNFRVNFKSSVPYSQ